MPTTGLRSWGRRFRLPVFLSLLILLSAARLSFAQNEEAAWLPVIAKLASSLSQNDAVGALAAFDSRMKDYGSVESYINALVSQTDVLCAIDVVQDKQSGDARTLDVD